MAYAQREVVEASFRAAASAAAGFAAPLQRLVLLYALRCLQGDAAWLITQELVSLPIARALPGAALPGYRAAGHSSCAADSVAWLCCIS